MSDLRWIWALSSDDVLKSMSQAMQVYHKRFGCWPAFLYVHPTVLQRLQLPLGVAADSDRHLNRAMVAFELPAGWVEEAAL